jgi:hypothetical protein
MTMKVLYAADFLENDIHRPLTTEEINEINPQAAVDKTLGAGEDEVSADTGVDRAYPHEEPLPENVTMLPTETSHDLPPETILRKAHDCKLTNMVICGEDEEGHEYVMHTSTDPSQSIWTLQRALHILNLRYDRAMMERYGQDLDDHPNTSA